MLFYLKILLFYIKPITYNLPLKQTMKDFKKYYTILAPSEEVYLALTIPLSIKLWSGAEAEMSTEPGSEFSLFDGDVVGKNLEFIEGKKIVQQWYFEGQDEESIVTMKIHEGKSKGSSSVELLHTNIPDDVYDEFVDGWNTSYFGELYEFFDGE
jgi:activator of HSP90 ATPase